MCREEECGHGRGGEDEVGVGGLPRRPHQGQGALGHWEGALPLELQFSMYFGSKCGSFPK